MDRLICGDVGFGKTEVALRAAFIAAMNGKQVAVVVPTTLLARQHFKTFTERLQGYPVHVAQASRLVVGQANSPRSRRASPTARSTSSSAPMRCSARAIKFKDLGLIVVDEEQHFGVAHKEKLKQLRAEVHVLTLTATPIPRTLAARAHRRARHVDHRHAAGRPARGAHLRVAVRSGHGARGAAARALSRRPGVLCLPAHRGLWPTPKTFLDKNVPEVRVAVAHGQMPPTVLEDIMSAFYDGKYDVLLSTTIIESGLDIPTANTLIVHRADMFGLSQLYQLRGRVGALEAARLCAAHAAGAAQDHAAGRAPAQGAAIARHARRRLPARLARSRYPRRRQSAWATSSPATSRKSASSFISRCWRRRCSSLKAGIAAPVADRWSPQITIGTPVLIPEDYVADLPVRLALYRRLAEIEDERDIEGFAAELVDRFGPLPEEVEHLLQVVAIKALCRRANVEKIEAGPKGAVLSFRDNIFANPEGLIAYIAKHPVGARVRPDMKVVFFDEWDTAEERLKGATEILRTLSGSRRRGGRRRSHITRKGGPCGRPVPGEGTHKGRALRPTIRGTSCRWFGLTTKASTVEAGKPGRQVVP